MSFDWLLGKSSSSSSSPSYGSPSPPSTSSQHSSSSPSHEPAYDAPSIDTLLTPTDPARLHPLANLDKQTLDYIILEDQQITSAGALPSRGWTDDLCYGTGATYLTGTLSPHLRMYYTRLADADFFHSPRCRRNVGIHRGAPKTPSKSPGAQHVKSPDPRNAGLRLPQCR